MLKLDFEDTRVAAHEWYWKEVEGLSFEEGLDRGGWVFATDEAIYDLLSQSKIEPVYEHVEIYEYSPGDSLYEKEDRYDPSFDVYDRGYEDWLDPDFD